MKGCESQGGGKASARRAQGGVGFLGRGPASPSPPARGSGGVLQAPPAGSGLEFGATWTSKVTPEIRNKIISLKQTCCNIQLLHGDHARGDAGNIQPGVSSNLRGEHPLGVQLKSCLLKLFRHIASYRIVPHSAVLVGLLLFMRTAVMQTVNSRNIWPFW